MTDYAVVVATHLALKAHEPAQSVRGLALETGIPEPTVSKVLKRLAREGVVASLRGVHGGYRLAKSASGISIAEIIAALEGPIAVTECSDESVTGTCDREPSCGVRTNWQRINAAVERALRGISLEDMARPVAASELISLSRMSGERESKRSHGN